MARSLEAIKRIFPNGNGIDEVLSLMQLGYTEETAI